MFWRSEPLPAPPSQVIDNAQSSGVAKETLAGTSYAVIFTKDHDLVGGHPDRVSRSRQWNPSSRKAREPGYFLEYALPVHFNSMFLAYCAAFWDSVSMLARGVSPGAVDSGNCPPLRSGENQIWCCARIGRFRRSLRLRHRIMVHNRHLQGPEEAHYGKLIGIRQRLVGSHCR